MEDQSSRHTTQHYALGHGRVQLRHLRFESGVRDIDEANISRLCRIFESEGCRREDLSHSIPCLISRRVFEELARGDEHPQDLILPADMKILCLHGRSRTLAACKVLQRRDHWWNVTFYDEDLPQSLRISLTEEFQNELPFSDGDIFRFYREAQRLNNQESVRRWQARLSVTKTRNMMQLEKADHGRVIELLDKLLPFRGLWQDFSLGAMNRILPMRMWEEIERYLTRMLTMWEKIMGDLRPCELSPQIVHSVQLRIPSHSASDVRVIAKAFDSMSASPDGTVYYSLLPNITDSKQRQDLIDRLGHCNRILSFHSFFEDTIYLKVCHSSMRKLLTNRWKCSQSFKLAFQMAYRGDKDMFESRYIELLLFSMRYHPELSDDPASQPREYDRRKKVRRGRVSGTRLSAFSRYAESLSFDVPDLEVVSPVTQSLSMDLPAENRPQESNEISDLPISARANRPFDNTFTIDRKYLFLQHILNDFDTTRLEYVTSFAIAREFVRCFMNLEACSGVPLSQVGAKTSLENAQEDVSVYSDTGKTDDEKARHYSYEPGRGEDVLSTEAASRDGVQQPPGWNSMSFPDHNSMVTPRFDETARPPHGSAEKGKKRVAEAGTRDRDLLRVQRAQESVGHSPDAWCIVDASETPHVFQEFRNESSKDRINDVFKRYFEASHYLQVYINSEGKLRTTRTISAWAALSAERPYKILFITPKSGRGQDYLAINYEGREHIMEWQMTGDESSRRMLLTRTDTGRLVWEQKISCSKDEGGWLRDSNAELLKNVVVGEGYSEVEIVFNKKSNPVTFKFTCKTEGWVRFVKDKSDYFEEEL